MQQVAVGGGDAASAATRDARARAQAAASSKQISNQQ
jgi:hypothetical protein